MTLTQLMTVLLAPILAVPAAGQFGITFDFEGTLSSGQQVIFQEAADTWEGYITGYQDGVTLDGITIKASDNLASDGVGGTIIGPAAPTSILVQGSYILPVAGTIDFDANDVAAMEDDLFRFYITRAIGHVLGIGTLWSANGVYTVGTGEYSGSFGLEAYQEEFDGSAIFIPVELGETTQRYWDEVDEGASLTGITDAYGRDLANELMTGWLGPDAEDTFISETTVMSLQDLGYMVQYSIPEPSQMMLLSLGALLPLARRRRRT